MLGELIDRRDIASRSYDFPSGDGSECLQLTTQGHFYGAVGFDTSIA